jgi:hypothetical protein
MENVVKKLEELLEQSRFNDSVGWNPDCDTETLVDALALLKALDAFKSYFDGLYGQGLDVANYHLNGATEPFDSFYDSAMEEYENAECK